MSVSEAIPGASRLRNQNEILIEKSDEAIKNKIKKSPSLEFFCFSFWDNLNPVVAVSFLPLTAPDVQLPLQSLARSPPRGELKTVSFASVFTKCRFVSPSPHLWGEG